MDLSYLAVQLIVAIVCAGIANILIPRRIPGGSLGLIVTGLVGVWLGEEVFKFLRRQYELEYPILRWSVQNVSIVPSIIGAVVVIYLVTTFLRWTTYRR
ncbi:hypothetical protein H6F43_19380 [Leptolyngbya sp. FACHB-36]|uniref:GlsB/YeaQ/YmgE family stress response membrane protein n=1 Tax=Leptolyngbya sp. FACHB-36 TaxID=2692808 RepID=UPI0016812FD1|nr:hypothetical protein [Leptolyngbya sp. FACHB-36]MBD2022346.1 hypothetical protein [Leptolyngbya sp. FACHB-36]